ncbi:MAG: hypothetical protein PHU93_03880 [Candidatus Gracilibacteria bacterium]|nr:hypothetical protein [Candidatus Gracilibacteria bacterium]
MNNLSEIEQVTISTCDQTCDASTNIVPQEVLEALNKALMPSE